MKLGESLRELMKRGQSTRTEWVTPEQIILHTQGGVNAGKVSAIVIVDYMNDFMHKLNRLPLKY
jgi:hypothetical protein